MSSPVDEYASPREAGRGLVDYLRDAFISGLAVVVPFVVTVVVLVTVVQYVVRYVYAVLGAAPPTEPTPLMTVAVVVALLAFVLLVGFVTQFRYGEAFIEYVDAFLSRIPGFGAIYDSFREMSDVMMESDQESFRDVKLVEFPHEGAYTLGFLTAESAGQLQDAVGREDLVTLFLPLAPNPVMGGHLVHVPAGRVMDVDMTVDEGIRTVVTSGVATGRTSEGSGDGRGLSADELERLATTSETAVGAQVTPDQDVAERGRRGADRTARRGAYESYAAPDAPDEESVPSDVESYRDAGTLGDDQGTPDAVESGTAAETLGDDHDTPTDVAAEGDGSANRDGDPDGNADPDANDVPDDDPEDYGVDLDEPREDARGVDGTGELTDREDEPAGG